MHLSLHEFAINDQRSHRFVRFSYGAQIPSYTRIIIRISEVMTVPSLTQLALALFDGIIWNENAGH